LQNELAKPERCGMKWSAKFKNCEAFFKCAEKICEAYFFEDRLIFLQSLKIKSIFCFTFFEKVIGRNCVSFFSHAHRVGASGGRFQLVGHVSG